MKKINKIEIKINIKKNIFDVNMKRDFSPVKILMVGNKIMAEYAMIMMENNDTNMFDDDISSLTKRLDDLGDIKLVIEEYEANTFGLGKQILHEVKQEKGYNIKDAFAIISVAMTYIKDTLITAYGMDNKVYLMDKEDAIDCLAKFERSLDTYKKVSDMYGMSGYVYKNFEASLESLVSNIGYMSEICGDMANEFLTDSNGQNIFASELFEEHYEGDKNRPEFNAQDYDEKLDSIYNEDDLEMDSYKELASESYDRIMGIISNASHDHECCGHDHTHQHN